MFELSILLQVVLLINNYDSFSSRLNVQVLIYFSIIMSKSLYYY